MAYEQACRPNLKKRERNGGELGGGALRAAASNFATRTSRSRVGHCFREAPMILPMRGRRPFANSMLDDFNQGMALAGMEC